MLGDIFKHKKNNTENSKKTLTPVSINQPISIEKDNPIIDIFDKKENLKLSGKQVFSKVQKLKFLGPFERYKLVKPYIQAEEKKKEQFENEKALEVKAGALELLLKMNENIKSDDTDGNEENNTAAEENKSNEERIASVSIEFFFFVSVLHFN